MKRQNYIKILNMMVIRPAKRAEHPAGPHKPLSHSSRLFSCRADTSWKERTVAEARLDAAVIV